MFIAVKDKIGLEIGCLKEELTITPFCIDNDLYEKAKAIADEEADQALDYLKTREGENDELVLRSYFEEKGWRITNC
jgi:hypothetical protein